MNWRRIATGLAVAAALSACAGRGPTGPAVAERFEPEIPCVGYLDQVPVRPLPPADNRGRPQSLDIREVASCLRRADGSAEPVAIFELGERSGPSALRFEVVPAGQQILSVALQFLDSDRHPVDTVGFDTFRRRGRAHTRTVYLNPEDSAIRYVVVRPDRAWLGRKDLATSGTSVTAPIVVPVAGGVLFGSLTSGYETQQQRVFSEVGTIRLWLEPQDRELLD